MKLDLIAESLDCMFPADRVQVNVNAEGETCNAVLSIGEYIRLADDFPKRTPEQWEKPAIKWKPIAIGILWGIVCGLVVSMLMLWKLGIL